MQMHAHQSMMHSLPCHLLLQRTIDMTLDLYYFQAERTNDPSPSWHLNQWEESQQQKQVNKTHTQTHKFKWQRNFSNVDLWVDAGKVILGMRTQVFNTCSRFYLLESDLVRHVGKKELTIIHRLKRITRAIITMILHSPPTK